ncbi:adenylate cyclase type 2-like isoform X1 [Diorhabda sublineata]|uniref:adenylate cyclase type 2-like isoform X1 n=1 Tax=Diorhabda sublineata TaxID=1163346 RepID=UPI0024E0E42D|nr:adenylate cyclase type 2-like isoform X1 [Diorhabda sublineata]XP_056634717.1 adenylate cyclase type 2-like isoform X1 [Diorhabda sublineata]XP_056634718.1 adenylate cyclase type 2-like isoform X1 [Diorhabda sublineata]
MEETDSIDNVILSRISLKDISLLSEDDFEGQILKKSPLTHDERKWRLSHLRNQFESYELQDLFKSYTKKVNHGYLSLFLILQCFLCITHVSFVVYRNYTDLSEVLPDVILYLIIIILSISCLFTVDRIASKWNKLHYVAFMAFSLVFFVNFFVPIYHSPHGKYRPAYTPHLIVTCYLFLGIEKLSIASLMGAGISIFHLSTLYFVTYSNDDMIWRKIISDAIFTAFMNCQGIYYRFMNEIVIRRSFLDRRDCIMSTHQLKHEKAQVDQLMQSIIPDYVINKVKEIYIEATKAYIESGKYITNNPFNNSLLDEHENVSILFADIVNYTEMTGKLKITHLLETLNDLFGVFDEYSTKLKVTRIKFLGDCYYCVAGLPPDAAPNSAEACVDLGLAMIDIIAAVRKKRNLNINMRIGVHSGRIISGIIGSVKYQFDIWSKDVDIANKMESEGQAGMVHITNKTKDLLKKNYLIEPTNKGETVPQFKNSGLQTFLIRPFIENNQLSSPTTESAPSSPIGRPFSFTKQRSIPNNLPLLSMLQRQPSVIEEENDAKTISFVEDHNRHRNSDDRLYRKSRNNSNNYYQLRASESRRTTGSWKRRTAFMNNNIKRYSERTVLVNKEMEDAIKKISFSKYKQYVKVKEINILLLYNNLKVEMEYLKIPDALFKYYLLGAACLIFCVYLIQNITLLQWDLSTWPFLATALPLLLIIVPISWAEHFYNKYIASYMNEQPKNVIVRFFYRVSTIMTNSFWVRLFIFLVVYVVFSICVLTEIVDCKNTILNDIPLNSRKTTLLSLLISNDLGDDVMIHCVLPWHMTDTCAMTVIMSFLFLRIFIWIKLLLGTVIISLYAYCVLSSGKRYYQGSETFNHLLEPQVAHIMSTVFLIVTLHLVDRQTDYMNRLDYLLNRRFKSEQDEANLLQKVNENLLLNILPKHVANLYLDVSREQKDLYFEEHSNVAVMFASIITDNELQDILDEKEFLSLMNSYITSFDILTNRKEFQSVEKIKVAKWTYMVACGLFANNQEDEFDRHQSYSSIGTLLSFASEMFKKLDQVNRTFQQRSRLRIGICHGSIAAGVVGSKKPLYDIWGDPVNMASRMDSTGEPDRIQVMEYTAKIIQKLGYKCTSRGDIYVKGKSGLLKTYFVDIDENFNLVKCPQDLNGHCLFRM